MSDATRSPISADWRDLASLGEQIAGTTSFVAQRDRIIAMTSRLLQLAPESERPVYLGTYAAAIGASTAIGSLVAGLITQAVPIAWIPLIFLASFLVRGLGMLGLRRAPA